MTDIIKMKQEGQTEKAEVGGKASSLDKSPVTEYNGTNRTFAGNAGRLLAAENHAKVIAKKEEEEQQQEAQNG
jgi:hypothetical protein